MKSAGHIRRLTPVGLAEPCRFPQNRPQQARRRPPQPLVEKSGRPDLNRGPHRPERCALPGCATPRRAVSIPHRYRRPVPVELTEVLAEIDALLGPERFEDYCVNGLQVPGAQRVATVATGVSAHAELFSLAAAEGADLVLVHHGLFWGPGVQALDEVMAQRLRLLLESRIALAAYHL